MVSRILLLISMISMVFVGTNAECMGCGTRYECKDGKYLYTYTGDQGTSTHSGVSATWPSAGTLGNHAVYTTTKNSGCYGGDSGWPLVKTPALKTYESVGNSCNGCGTRYECKDGKYLYTYTGDQGTSTHTGTSEMWPSAGTLGNHAVYTTTKNSGCYRGDDGWPLVKTPALETHEKMSDLKCSQHSHKKHCKKDNACVWIRKQCISSV